MYFKTEILFFGICHAVEWNFGAGFVFDMEMQTLCAKFVSHLYQVSHVCLYHAYCPLSHCVLLRSPQGGSVVVPT